MAAHVDGKTGKQGGVGRVQKAKRRHYQRQLHQACEVCEPRFVLSSITLVDGTLNIALADSEQNLSIFGNEAGDTLIIEIDNNVAQTFPIDEVNNIVITGNELDNAINLQGIPLGAIQGSVIYGNGGDDFIVGSMSNDLIVAGDGDDIAAGGGQSDTLQGESGNDTLMGSSHPDVLAGGDGDDHLSGQAGDDSPMGGPGDDIIIGDCGDTCDAVGLPPIIARPQDQHGIEGTTVSLQVVATDTDVLIYEATGLPAGLSINPKTGKITGQIGPKAFDDGPVYTVKVSVTDSTPTTVSTTFKWGITEVFYTKEPTKTNQHVWGHEFQWKVNFANNVANGKIVVQQIKATMKAFDSANKKTRKLLSTVTMVIIDLHAIGNTSTDTQDFGPLKVEIIKWREQFPGLKFIEFKREGDWRLVDSVDVKSEGDEEFRPFDPATDKQGAVSIKVSIDGDLKSHRAVEIDGKNLIQRDTPSYSDISAPGQSRFRINWNEQVDTRLSSILQPVARGDGTVEFSAQGQHIKTMDRKTVRTLADY